MKGATLSTCMYTYLSIPWRQKWAVHFLESFMQGIVAYIVAIDQMNFQLLLILLRVLLLLYTSYDILL